MDPSLKETLLDRLSSYLDGLDAADAETAGLAPTAAETPSADEEARDLFSVFVELAAVRNEARAQARIVKEAFDQFRAVFETLQSSNAALDRELKEAHARAREQSRSVLRPLLIDIIDVRDRLSAGLAAAPHERAPSWWAPWRRSASEPDPWREGLAMTLRRLDRVLADRRVTPIVTVGRPFSPAVARGRDAGRSVRRGRVGDRRIPRRLRMGWRAATGGGGDRGQTRGLEIQRR